ncbi:MAG: hypothetical protein EDM05_56180 [Leptolyngbya sp. IPPAS B-1204]
MSHIPGYVFIGTPANDWIEGSPYDDLLDGLAGDDVLLGVLAMTICTAAMAQIG